MKKILLLLFAFPYLLFSCEASLFKIYYIPLTTEFYAPPSREDIMEYDINFTLKSCHIHTLFKLASLTKNTHTLKGEESMIRIMLVDKNNRELFLTKETYLLSLKKELVYDIDSKFITNVFAELERYVSRNYEYQKPPKSPIHFEMPSYINKDLISDKMFQNNDYLQQDLWSYTKEHIKLQKEYIKEIYIQDIVFFPKNPFQNVTNEKHLFKVYYIPLTIDTYVPVKREDIISSDINFTITSDDIPNLFNITSSLKNIKILDREQYLIRIMLVDENHNELFITQDKKLISLSKKEVYPINLSIVNRTICMLKKYIKLYHHDSINYRYIL